MTEAPTIQITAGMWHIAIPLSVRGIAVAQAFLELLKESVKKEQKNE